MVKASFIRIWVFLSFFLTPLAGQDVVVEAFIDQNQGISNVPLTGTITITHNRKALIDPQSFQLASKLLSTTLTKEVSTASGEDATLISIYEFELPAKQKGLYILDPISVKVGGKTYQSMTSTYEVKDIGSTSKTSSIKKTSTDNLPIVFKLEASVKGPSSLYPGERAKLFYRITYNRSIDLTYSDFPLLYTQEFHKIGDEQVKDYEKGDLTYQDITQEIEAFKPGTFRYEPSVIEGYAYQINNLGQKVYLTDKLHAEAPAVEVVVKPFPIEKQPASFTGIIGKLDVQLQMLTQSDVSLGSQVLLELTISGAINLADAHLPDLHCQPGFSGFFDLNDLPPLANIKDDVKHFRIELRPISMFVREIPSIEISSFDPETKEYAIWHSDPIPLKIKPSIMPELENASQSAFIDPGIIFSKWTQSNLPLPPLELKGIEVTPDDLHFNWLGTRWVLWIIPIGILLLYLQKILFNEWKNRRQFMRKTSTKALLHQALNKHLDLGTLIRQLKEVFLQRLKEKDYIQNDSQDVEKLPLIGLVGEVRTFILDLEALRYGSKQEFDLDQIRQKAQILFAKI